MAFNSPLPLVFISLTLLTTAATASVSCFLNPQETAITTTTTTTVPPLPLNITSIISAVISAGNFQNWATLLSENPSLLPRNFTLFLPSTTSINSSIFSPSSFNNPFLYIDYNTISYNQEFIFHQYHKNHSSSVTKTVQELRSYFLLLYHIVPIRLSFSELCRFPASTRLPTLLPDYNLSIIKNSNNYNCSVSCSIVIHGSCITGPNLYQDEYSFAHGVGSTFDYTKHKKVRNEKKSLSWKEIWRKLWMSVCPALWGAHYIYLFNPRQLYPVVINWGQRRLRLLRRRLLERRAVAERRHEAILRWIRARD